MAIPPRAEHTDCELYHLLVDSVVDYAIFALDAAGNVATWNKGAQRLKGYAAKEIIGRHFSVFYPEEDVRADKPRRELEVATEKGRIEDEGWRVRKDGSRFWANVVITALRDGSGTLVGFAKVTRDLTARRAAEEQGQRLSVEKAHKNAAQDLAQELEQSNLQLEETLAEVEEGQEALKAAEERMRFLVQAGDTLAASLDYETNLQALARMVVPDLADWCVVEMAADGQTHQLAVAHVNPTKVQLARDLSRRYPQNAASLTGAPHVIRTGQPQLYAKITEQMLQAGATNREHLALLRELNLKSAMILPLIARGRTLGTMTLVAAESGRHFGDKDLAFGMELARRAALAVDNARLHAEALDARGAAERAAESKTRFLAVMSHELRTPLNAIGGYAELIAMGVRGPITAEQKKDLDRIMANQATLLALINDVLDYAKLESGSMPLDIHFVNVRREVEEIEALIAPQLQAKQLRYEYAACAPEMRVCADPRSLRQILLNLLSNAIKFTAPRGRVALACSADGDKVRIDVTDTGIGIAPDKLDTIFEPFVQLDRDSSHPKEGTGLGLSISRDFARAMRGDLVAESQAGKGSTFSVILPSASAADSCEPTPTSESPQSHRTPERTTSKSSAS